MILRGTFQSTIHLEISIILLDDFNSVILPEDFMCMILFEDMLWKWHLSIYIMKIKTRRWHFVGFSGS